MFRKILVLMFSFSIFLYSQEEGRDSISLDVDLESSLNFSVTSGDWTITWNDSSAVAVDNLNGNKIIIFTDRIIINETILPDSTYQFTFQSDDFSMLSIVGPVVSYSFDWHYDFGYSVNYGTFYESINLESPEDFKPLTFFFDEKEVFSEVTKTKLISERIKGKSAPADLKQLIELLSQDCDINFSELLKTFAFKEISHDTVTVQFGLPHGCDAEMGKFTMLDVKFKVTPSKLKFFNEAEQNETLMKNIGGLFY
ncbi:MAG: hypothetical protein HXY49_12125 [Ignavibacteriaceae bacterium]|nr:hypothetical protein [Ignavibacteriaceae bacterium]